MVGREDFSRLLNEGSDRSPLGRHPAPRYPKAQIEIRGERTMTTATAERRPRLEGRTAIVTGAGTGIGQGIAVAMAKEGANIIIVGRTEATLQETSSRIEDIGGTVLPITGSVSEKDTPERVVAKAVEA